MAIKVNGTTVINDSRALSNIASVDATTAASITAAGVGGSNILTTEVVEASKTYTFVATGTITIQAVGAGGSGSIYATNNSLNGRRASASGGAAGGYVRKEVAVTAGDTISITIGAGGARVPQTSGNEQSGGNAGGSTTVTGSNLGSGNTSISLTAGGGAGGKLSGSNSYGDSSVTSNTGGTASGGDTNSVGGSTSVTTNSSSYTFDDGTSRLGGSRGAFPTILGSPESVTVALDADGFNSFVYRNISASYPAAGSTTPNAANDATLYALKRSVGFTDASQMRAPLPVVIRRQSNSIYGSYLSDSNAPDATIGAQPFVGVGGPPLLVVNRTAGTSYAAGSYGSNGAVYITYKDV